MRSLLHLCVLSGIRCNPVIQAFYRHLLKAGKPTRVAMVACMRKLLVLLNAMLRSQQAGLALGVGFLSRGGFGLVWSLGLDLAAGDAPGGSGPRVGGAAHCAAWENPPAPAFPGGGTGRGRSRSPCCRRLIFTLTRAEIA